MQVEITVKVNGEVVREHVRQVNGTLEQMEETLDAMAREVACGALQASVDAVPQPRPLFQKTAESCGTKDTEPGR